MTTRPLFRLLPALLAFALGAAHAFDLSVADFGAKGDGVTLNTGAIQHAIDAAAQQGDSVVFPAGTYLTGELFLRTGVTLRLDQGAVLRASGRGTALVNVVKANHAAITGRGTLAGERLVRICDAADIQLGDGLLLRHSGSDGDAAGVTIGGPAQDIRIHDIDMMDVPTVLRIEPGIGAARVRDVRIWNLKATGARTVFAAAGAPAAGAPAAGAPEHFTLADWDVQAATVGTVGEARDWTLRNVRMQLGEANKVQTLFGNERVIEQAATQARAGVAHAF